MSRFTLHQGGGEYSFAPPATLSLVGKESEAVHEEQKPEKLAEHIPEWARAKAERPVLKLAQRVLDGIDVPIY